MRIFISLSFAIKTVRKCQHSSRNWISELLTACQQRQANFNEMSTEILIHFSVESIQVPHCGEAQQHFVCFAFPKDISMSGGSEVFFLNMLHD